MKQSRRQFLQSTFGSAALAALPLGWQRALAANSTPLGDTRLTVLSDGNLVLPAGFILPTGLPEKELTTFLTENDLTASQFEPPCNIALWQNDDRTILFDVGAGPNFMPSAGQLLESLDDAGIDPSDITDVVFTHAHPDHLWGLVDDFDELSFPDAEYHMHATEWDFWRAADTIDKLSDARKTFAVGAQNRLVYLEDQIKLFNYGDEILPGVEAVDSHGHTPGHTSFALHAGSSSVMLLGDAITHPVLSFARYDWPSGSDQDPEQGRLTRKTLLDRLSYEQSDLLGYHLPHPGLGRVERDGNVFRYLSDG